MLLGSSLHVDGVNIATWAAKIVAARALYGPDSTYVIGLVTAFEWVCEQAEGGAALKVQLHRKIIEAGEGKTVAPAALPAASSPIRRPTVPEEGATESLVENSWVNGVVKWFNNDKGYGFISTDGDTDVFVHWRDISTWDRSLSQGDAVEFMVTRTAKGFQAINVMKPGAEGGEGAEGNSPAEAAEASEAVPSPPEEPDAHAVPVEEPLEEAAEAQDDAEEQKETS